MGSRGWPRGAAGAICVLLAVSTAAAQSPSSDAELFDLPFEELLKVVVSASTRAQPLREAPATIHVVTAAQIAERGYQTLEDAVQDLPGIDLVRVGGAFPTILAPRGAYGDENRRILLLVDGIVQNSLNGAFELGGPAYSLFGVERIEVIFGPASALYGANAFSGIINLISRTPGDASTLDYRHVRGSYDSQRDDVFVATAPKSGIALGVSATRLRSDGPGLDRIIDGYADGYVDDALGWNLRLTLDGDGRRSVFGLHGTDTAMGNGGFGNTPTEFLGLPPRSPDNPGTGGFYHARLGGEPPGLWHPYTQTVFAEHRHDIGALWQLQARLSHRRNGLRDDSHSYSVNRDRSALTRFHGAYDNERVGIELQATRVHGDTASTTAGLQYFDDDIERGYRGVVADPTIVVVDGIPLTNIGATFLPRAAVSSHDAGVFVEHQRRTTWLRDTKFTLGARYDRNRLYGSSFNPRLGLVNHPGDDWTLKLLAGTAYRAPTPFELFGTSPVRIANPELQPERVRALEFAAGYRHAAHYLQATAFHNRLDDLIVEGVPVGNGITQIQNAARGRVFGVTSGWDYRPGGAWKLYANLTWQDAEQDAAGGARPIANVARWKANAGGHWRFAPHAEIHLAARWVGRRSVAPSNPLGSVPGYAVADLFLAARPFGREWLRLSLGVRNLADRHYTDPGIRQADGSSFSPQLEQPGRSVWLGVELALR